jgi:hypothetical protein
MILTYLRELEDELKAISEVKIQSQLRNEKIIKDINGIVNGQLK